MLTTTPTHRVALRATTRRVLPALDGPVPEAWRHHHARLLELREQVIQETQELSREAAELAPVFNLHPAEAANDCFDRELALGLLCFEQNALNEIDEALQRVRDGRYGICELTGQPIPRRRLEAIPWARHTVEAQAELERTTETPPAHRNGARPARPGPCKPSG